MKTLNELSEFNNLLQEKIALEEKNKQFLNKTVFVQKILFHKIPKIEKVLSKRIKEALALNKSKCLWVDLNICDPFLDNVYIFAREKDLLSRLRKVAKMIITRQEWKMGYISISLVHGRFSFKDFI